MAQPLPIRLQAPFIRETDKEMSENTGEKQRLLIVDDSKVIRVTARKILQNHFETVEAVDGENAWEILTGMGPFSLIVSDLTMPKLDGYGLLEKIRSANDPHISNLPVIVITGDNDSEKTMRRAREAGATDFIGKPFDAVHLLARAQSHASAHAERQSLTEQNITLEDQALIDTQTGLPNEAAFMARSQQQLSYAIRHNTTLTVAQLEIDNYGELFRQHDDPIAGMVVKYAASVIASDIRQEDMTARIGTARFAMLLSGMEQSGIQTLTDRISKDISERVIKHGGEEIRFTVSIGICCPDIQGDTRFDDLLKMAGNNLRQAITGGGNRTIFANGTDIDLPCADDTATEDTTADSSSPCQDIEEIVCQTVTDRPADARPLAANDSATEEAVAIMDDASVAEMLASTIEQPALYVEASVPETAQQADMTEAATPQTATDEQLPEMFADPVTGVSKRLASKVTKARQLAAAEEKEEIVITAPYVAPSDGQPQQTGASAREQETTATSGQPEQAGTLPAAAESSAAGLESSAPGEIATTRPGLFRRILALFSRSGR